MLTREIESREDIILLVNKFYDKVKGDDLLEPVFSHLDWELHLPIMYNFWSSAMLDEQSYRGNPFQKHINLSLRAEHFTQWLKLFIETTDQYFVGSKAEEIKERAKSIAGVFQYKLGLLQKP